jgi:transposase
MSAARESCRASGCSKAIIFRDAIEKARATLRYLPKYSPDLNPIEMAYSKFKAFLRKVAARTVPSLNRAIRSFIPQLSPQECANYFTHAGYASI